MRQLWYNQFMFLDKAKITIKAGNGGNGHVSFFRDKMTMRGGPDGGDGGRGGDIVFVGTTRVDNLVDFRFTKKFRADDGLNGGKRHCSGKTGEVKRIPVPLGTRIHKLDGELLADITEDGQEFMALRGGAGGRGNAHYATAKKQTPNFSQTGLITKEHEVILELQTIADVGLVGFPNVGKSTMLSVVTRANPKIANYHFTTLHPNVGVANVHGKNIVIADIPGLIEGAADGAGLGHQFLRHIARTRVLVHVVDIAQLDGRCAVQDFATINAELAQYDSELAKRPMVVALNKVDSADEKVIKNFRKFVKKIQIFEISAVIGQGMDELLSHVAQLVEATPRPEVAVATGSLDVVVDKNEFTVEKLDDGTYTVHGPMIDNLIRGVILTDVESNRYFQRRLEQSGAIAQMRELGMQDGDTVVVAEIEFEWRE